MQSVSSRIWTCVAVSTSYDDNHYSTGTTIILNNRIYLWACDAYDETGTYISMKKKRGEEWHGDCFLTFPTWYAIIGKALLPPPDSPLPVRPCFYHLTLHSL